MPVAQVKVEHNYFALNEDDNEILVRTVSENGDGSWRCYNLRNQEDVVVPRSAFLCEFDHAH